MEAWLKTQPGVTYGNSANYAVHQSIDGVTVSCTVQNCQLCRPVFG